MSITNLDFMILDAIQKIRNPFLDSFFATITHLGDSGILAILIAVLLIFGMKKKYRQTGISLAFALVIAFVLGNLILKNVIARPRPCWVRESIGLIAVPKDYSFPSGHTHVSVLLAVVLWHENRKWGIAALCLAVLVAFSRMYLYVHYPTDILGGALLGAFAGWAGIRVSEWITEKRKGRKL